MNNFFLTKKGLVTLIFCLTMLTTLLLFFFSLSIDKKYSELIEQNSKVNETIQEIVVNSNNYFHTFYDLDDSYSPEINQAIKQKWKNGVEKNSAKFQSLTENILLVDSVKKALSEVTEARKKYIVAGNLLFDSINKNSPAYTNTYLRKSVKPFFETYQNELASFFKKNERQLLGISNGYSSTNKKIGVTVVSIGLFPLIILLVVIIITLILLARYVILTKGFVETSKALFIK